MHQNTGQFTCDACGKRYRLKPELAGRTVKCGCGQVMTCPTLPVQSEPGDLYDIAPALASPAPSAAQAPPDAVLPAAVPLAYQSGRDAGDAAMDEAFPDRTIDFYLPLALIAGGTVVEFAAALLRGGSAPAGGVGAMGRELATLATGMLGGTFIMLIGVLIAARVRGITLGPIPVAAFKLAAVAIAPAAIATLVSPILAIIPFGGMGVFIIQFAVYFALLGTLFKLDESDTWYCVCVIFLIGLAVYFGQLALRNAW